LVFFCANLTYARLVTDSHTSLSLKACSHYVGLIMEWTICFHLTSSVPFPSWFQRNWGEDIGCCGCFECEYGEGFSVQTIEMIMGMGFPFPLGIPWESHGNGNWWHNWEWEWEGMGITLYGNGN